MSTDFTSIFNYLVDDMVTYLTESLIEETSDETKVGLLRAGKLQADPTDADRGLNVLVHLGGEDWPDELYVDQDGIIAPTYEIGGTQYWMRRFVIELILFYDGEDQRDIAREKSTVLCAHAQKALFNMPIPQVKDSFGESPLACQVRKLYQTEAGGEGTFIWRSRIFVEWLTVIQYNA